MKARFLVLAALMLGLASCQTEPEGLNVNVGGEVDTFVTVTIPETETRTGGLNSALGAFENVDLNGTNGTDYTVRYIFEVYYGETGVQKQVLYSDSKSVSFPVRLVPGRDYNFVAWADIAIQPEDAKMNKALAYEGNTTDVYYETSVLKNITVIDSDSNNEWNAMNEARDAYSGFHNTKGGEKYTGSSSINIRMTRPFAKLRVITTDMVELGNLHITPVSAKVTYSAFSHESFNALDGTYSGEISSKTHTYTIANYADQSGANKVLFTDYFFADDNDIVKFELDVYEGNVDNQNATTLIKHNDFKTDIPAQRNYLTTIKGNILTEGNNITVEVEDAFENAGDASDDAPYYKETISSAAEFLAALDKAGEFIVISDITIDGSLINAGSTVNNGQASTFATRAGGKTTIIDLNGLTITVDNQTGDALVSLDATDSLIFAGEGTIEGTGKLVEGGTVVVTGEATVAPTIAVDENGESAVKSGLEALKHICANGGEFTFANNLEANSPLAVTTTKPVVINGNGKTITYTGSDRAFNVNGLETANVTLNDLTFVNSASYSERCINFNVAGKLTLNNVTVSETGTPATYAINLPGSSDGAEVVINNSTIRGKIALNIWGENVVVDATNTIFSNYDSTEVEDYTTIVLNNDGSTVAEGAVVNIIGGKVIGKNEKDEPVYAVSNGTVTGVVNISETTEVIGAIKETVAIVDYNSTSFYSFTNIQGAINKVCKDKKGFVRLVKDITVDETTTIPADGNVTIDLNGKTITGTDKNTAGNFYLIDNRGTLTISDSSEAKTGAIKLSAETERNWSASSVVVANNPGGKLVIDGGLIEHLGGTSMAYGVDNLTNGKGTYAETVINGGTIKSTYRAVRMFLNGTEAQNLLTVNGGTIEGANKSIWMQDPSANANTGTLVVNEGATLNGDVYLFVCAGSTSWPVEVSIAASAVNGEVLTGNVPEGYAVVEENGVWKVKSYEAVADADGLFKNGVEYLVTNANGLATLNAMMANKTAGQYAKVVLGNDIDFTGKTWTPVDSHADTKFFLKEINGQGHTISNLTINGQAMFTRFAGFGDVTIKDITFDNATVTSNTINTSILTVQTYQNVLLDNVDVKNSSITGGYKVAPLIGTVYNEKPSAICATLKNCDVENVTVKATSYDFCTTGMVAFVYEGDNDSITFENCTVKDVKLMAKPNGYAAHAAIYVNDKDTDDLINEAEGVIVENVTFEAL